MSASRGCIDNAERLGLTIKPGSRIARYGRLLDDMEANGAAIAVKAWREVAHGSRDLFDILYICDVLAERHDARLRQVLPTLLSSAGTPDGDASTAARDLQFEMMVAAQFVAGALDVTFAEPDFLFECDGARYGVAAKAAPQRQAGCEEGRGGRRPARTSRGYKASSW